MWVKATIDPHITYSQKYIEFEACVEAGLKLDDWYYGRYSKEFKAQIVAFYNLRRLVSLHVEDAKSEDYKRRSSKKGN